METDHPIHETENHRVARAAGVVGLATMLSRVFGFIRDVIVARFFGAGLATDAFFVAFRIPNLLRRLFAEGSLTIAFVPVFTEYLKTKSREDAFELARVAFTLLSVILVVISLAGVIFSPAIVTVMAPGFRATPDKYALTVLLTRIMFPYIFFISLVALCMGILNSLRHFATPALSPVILNLCMIGAALFLRDYFAEPILALAVGVMIGGLLQLAVQLPVLFKLGVVLRPNFHFGHTGVRRIGALMLPAAFGAAVYQINIFISTLLASFLPEGSVSFLYYADRIVELPLGIFGIAIGTAALPSFSDQVARGHYEEMKKTISFSLRLMLFITIPAMIGIIALREPIISVLFQRGQFDPISSVLTAQALFWYTVGLWAFSTIRVVVAAFYALQDTKTPVRIAVVALIVNTVCSVALMFPMKHSGLALATSIASAVNVLTLGWLLRKRIGEFLDAAFWRSVARVTAASAIMWVSVALMTHTLGWDVTGPFRHRFLILATGLGVGITVFASCAVALRCPEMTTLFSMIRRKLGRR
ncbi:MAG TPA: murein biosynthesis integral membrane protein MurJ [Syntrophales bacterium]